MSSDQDAPKEEEITRFPLDWYSNFGLTAQSNAVRLARDKDGKLWGIVVTGFASNPASGTVRNYMPSAITDPTESAASGNSIARCFGNPTSGLTDATVGLVTNARQMVAMTLGSGTTTWYAGRGGYSARATSAVATARVFTLTPVELGNLHSTLDIVMVCSAGTATVTVEASQDNTNWLNIDTIAAAATTIKHYDPTVVGGGTYAVCPLAFPYLRITSGSAGAGNTTTTTIAMK